MKEVSLQKQAGRRRFFTPYRDWREEIHLGEWNTVREHEIAVKLPILVVQDDTSLPKGIFCCWSLVVCLSCRSKELTLQRKPITNNLHIFIFREM